MTTPQPKRSETDPPAANQPLNDGDSADRDGADADRDVADAPDSTGRRANDPSLSQTPVPETPQVPRGKPDGEVDTSR